MIKTATQRFVEKIEFGGDGCWNWTAARQKDGYGRFGWDSKVGYAHRFAYESAVGAIPPGLVVDHICNNKLCVRPEHLRAVTQQENALALHSNTKARINAEKTHCPKGHELSEDNLVAALWKAGRRSCLRCDRDRSSKKRAVA